MKEQENEIKKPVSEPNGENGFSELSTNKTKKHLISFHIHVAKVIKYLILADLFFLGGWSLINPIFSVFVVQEIQGGTIAVAGILAALYWIIRSVLQIPIATFLDRTEGERDELYALSISLGFSALAAFAFILAKTVPQIFIIQAIYAIAASLYTPAWISLFSRHLDKDRISFDWTLDSTGMGLASFISALCSGFIAEKFGFPAVFFLVGLASILALFAILAIPRIILPKGKERMHLLVLLRNYLQHLQK